MQKAVKIKSRIKFTEIKSGDTLKIFGLQEQDTLQKYFGKMRGAPLEDINVGHKYFGGYFGKLLTKT